jgi:hypothetical protein
MHDAFMFINPTAKLFFSTVDLIKDYSSPQKKQDLKDFSFFPSMKDSCFSNPDGLAHLFPP